jgi:hypothetical protein
MSTPTVKLIDITSDLSAHPTSADHDSQSAGSGAKPAVSAPKLVELVAASGQSPGWYRGDIQSVNRLVDGMTSLEPLRERSWARKPLCSNRFRSGLEEWS